MKVMKELPTHRPRSSLLLTALLALASCAISTVGSGSYAVIAN